MKSLLRKIAKAYAKSTTNTCLIWVFHASQTPRSLIKE